MSQSDAPDATKRIPKSLSTDPKLIRNYTLTDLVVAFVPGAAVVTLTRTALPPTQVAGYSIQALSLPLAAVATALGAVFVTLSPSYASSLRWLGAFVGFHRDAAEADHHAATQYTRVQRVWPDDDAIERTDGALVGMLSVTPPTMALATDAEWQTRAAAFTDVLDTTVEFPIQLYATTRSFPVDDYLAAYEQRLADPDVQQNDTLERLIESYVDWYRQDLQTRQMTIRDHYVIVPVRPREIRHTDESLVDQVADVRFLGPLIDAYTADPVAAERAAMLQALDDRLRTLERALRGIDGCRAQRVAAADMLDLLTAYWTGTDSVDDTGQTLRVTPIVGGPER